MKTSLDEGIKANEVRQKHIKIVDRSELGWAVVSAYEDDKLASNSEDEKHIYKAEREAERLSKRKRAASSAVAKRKVVTTRMEEALTATLRVPASSQSIGMHPPRPRIIGPCVRCREWCHLVVNCARPKQLYPFKQRLVRKAVSIVHDVSTVCVNDTELDALCETESCVSDKGVDEETEREISGVIADLQHKVGGNTCPEEGNNKNLVA